MNSASEDQTTLLSRMGGIPALRAVIDEFYDRILEDEQLAPFFDGVNMSHLKLHQLKFLKLALTKIPDDIDAHTMIAEKHRRLFDDKGLNESHFDIVAKHLSDTLKHLGVPQVMIDEALGIVGSLRVCFCYSSMQNAGDRRSQDVATAGEAELTEDPKKSFFRFIRRRRPRPRAIEKMEKTAV